MLPKICSFPECTNKFRAKGWCTGHYEQAKRVGAEGMTPLQGSHLSLRDRFEKYANKGEGCWNWQGARNRDGYGLFHVNKKTWLAHRYSFELANGPIPEGLSIDHMCHNTSCVNHLHLQAVSSRENAENRSGANAGSKTGIRGVAWNSALRKYQVMASSMGNHVYGGVFSSLNEAEKQAIQIRNEIQTNNLLDRNNNGE